ncbi:MAG TPA: ADOP family duplicated permease [Longimicrobiales bacterium]
MRRWFRLGDVERDVDEELALYFDETVRELEASGLSSAAAREEAERRFGDARVYRRELLAIDRRSERRQRWVARWEAVRDTARHAVRSVVRAPALAVGIVLAFALGIGANATMYATVERLLLRPPPHIEDAGGVRRLLVHRAMGLGERIHTSSIAFPDYLDFARTQGFAQVAAQYPSDLMLGSGESAEEVRGLFVTASWWPLLGVQPVLGRFFTAAEDRFGGARVAVLSHRRWLGEYGGAPDVLGRTIDFGHGPYTIIGVTPKGFTGIDLRPVDFFAPFMTAGEQLQGGTEWAEERNWHWLRAIARVAPGVSVEAAEAEATRHHRAGRASDTHYDRDVEVVAAPLLDAQGPNAPSEVAVARWLLGVATVVLLIACLNVANLLLARMIRQRREIAIRLALGVSRARLVAQIVVEGLILGVLGGAAALLLALWGGTYVQRMLLPDVDWDGSLSGTVVLVVLGLSLLAGVLSALVPAVQASRPRVLDGLRASGGGITRSTARVRATLSMVQAALSVVLLIGAGLFVRSLDSIRSGDFGIDPWNVAYVRPVFHVGTVEPAERLEYNRRALERVSRLDGVEAATMIAGVPFWTAYAYELTVPGLDSIPRTTRGGPYANVVSRDYFHVLGVDVVRGRAFDERDTRASTPVLVLSASFAQALWPGEDPIGRCIQVDGADRPCAEIVGVVEDASYGSLVEEVTYQYYMLFDQALVTRPPEGLLVRFPNDTKPVLAAVQREMLGVDDRVRFVRGTTLEEMLAPELRQWRLGAVMFSLFGLLALTVAAIGLYSVLAFDVAQRVREIGLRTALGATTRTIMGLVVARAAAITAAGVVLGIAVAFALAPRLESMLYGVGARDPLTFLGVAVTLGVISIAAAGLPALRAAKVDPNVALRAD